MKTLTITCPEEGIGREINPHGNICPPDNWPRGDDAVWEAETVRAMKSAKHLWEDFEQSVQRLPAFYPDGKPLPAGWTGEVNEVWQYHSHLGGWREKNTPNTGTFQEWKDMCNAITRRIYQSTTPAQQEEKECQPFENYPELTNSIQHAATHWKTDSQWTNHLYQINELCQQTASLLAENERLRECLQWIIDNSGDPMARVKSKNILNHE